MTAITIDKNKAIELLEAQVEKKGADYVYPYAQCLYFADEDGAFDEHYNRTNVECGTPLCILGNVYADLGLTVDDLRVNDTYTEHIDNWVQGQDGSIGYGFQDVLPDKDKVILTDGALDAFALAQSAQDNRQTWGDALKAAKGAVA